jgi:hypothetical protein
MRLGAGRVTVALTPSTRSAGCRGRRRRSCRRHVMPGHQRLRRVVSRPPRPAARPRRADSRRHRRGFAPAASPSARRPASLPSSWPSAAVVRRRVGSTAGSCPSSTLPARGRQPRRAHDGRGADEPIPAALPSDEPLFEVPDGLIRTFDRDLVSAGLARVEQRGGEEVVVKTDDRGRTIDIQALRHTFGTHLPGRASHCGPHRPRCGAAIRASRPTPTPTRHSSTWPGRWPACRTCRWAKAETPQIPSLHVQPSPPKHFADCSARGQSGSVVRVDGCRVRQLAT